MCVCLSVHVKVQRHVISQVPLVKSLIGLELMKETNLDG